MYTYSEGAQKGNIMYSRLLKSLVISSRINITAGAIELIVIEYTMQ